MKKDFLAERAKQLKIASRTISNSLRIGNFNSGFRGHGIEFNSVREYQIDDDVRSIDWNLTARSGKTYLKEYREEKDLTIFLCIDFSNSMEIGIEGISPKQKAIEAAALLAFAGLNLSSPIGAIFFSGQKGPLFFPHSSEDHILTILKSMEDFSNSKEATENNGTRMASSLKAISKILRTKAMIIIISDFKVEGYEKQLGLLASKNDVVCIKIINSLDKQIPPAGSIIFTDAEDSFTRNIQTSSQQFKLEYSNNFYEEITRWENTCKRVQANPLLLNVEEEIVKTLSNFFMSKHNEKKSRTYRWKEF